MADKKIQWHQAFTAAVCLEFSENRDDLIYEKEYNLNTKPLEIDLLVIKKQPHSKIRNEIGRLFRGSSPVKSTRDSIRLEMEEKNRKTILRAIQSYRDLSLDPAVIKQLLMKTYELSSREADNYVSLSEARSSIDK